MLYIKFEIQDSSKYKDFQKLYNHMVMVRQPGFKFDEEGPNFDWDTMTEAEINIAMVELNTFLDEQVEPEIYRCKKLLPIYVNIFLENYLRSDTENLESFGSHDIYSIFNYLEFGFEVDMDSLENMNERLGIVKFSTGNYPFGGLARFIMTLAAYDLKPIECFDGFNVCKFKWISEYKYESIISTQTKNPFQTFQKWINNTFFKKSLLALVLLIANNAIAQTNSSSCILNNRTNQAEIQNLLVLENPEFPSPEKELLFFFSESYFFDPHNYYGSVKDVESVHTIYDPQQRIISVDTSNFASQNHLLKNEKISRKPIVDHIGIDSISKKGHKIQLFHFGDFPEYEYQIYEVEKERIVNVFESTSVLTYSKDLTYDKNNNLIKIVTTDDYNDQEIELATYNSNGSIKSKKNITHVDGTRVIATNYSYKNNLIIQIEKHEAIYFLDLELEDKHVENIDYSKYINSNTLIILDVVNFTYNEDNQLIKIEENKKDFSESGGINYENSQTFSLNYQPNKLVINASFPELRNYEFLFDDLGNPLQINSYVVDENKSWLHKSTRFKIL